MLKSNLHLLRWYIMIIVINVLSDENLMLMYKYRPGIEQQWDKDLYYQMQSRTNFQLVLMFDSK